jgi:molybdenum cofactor cytidylyltransferase
MGAVVLAAGLSSRMGGPNKLLTPYAGEPLATYAFGTLASLGLRDCVAVTGRDADTVGRIASRFGLRSTFNTRYVDGLGSSLAFGVSVLDAGVKAIFVALADMPCVRASDYSAVADAFRPGAIVIPGCGGQRGHPVLFCASYRDELLELTGDTGARGVIRRHKASVVEVDAGHDGVIRDLDTPADFLEETPP